MRVFIYLITFLCISTNLMGAVGSIKTTVSLIILPEIERVDTDMMTLINVAQKNLSEYKGFEYIPFEILIDKKGFSAFFSDFKNAIKFISEGEFNYENLDFDTSNSLFTKAVRLLEKNSFFVNKRNLYTNALFYLGAMAVLTNKMDLAYNYFKQILTVDSRYKPDSSLFPPQIVEIFNKVAKEVLSASKCVVKFKVEPENAQVYLDGEFIGFSPIDRTGIVCGKHYYYVLAEGYFPSYGIVQITQEKIFVEISEALKATDNFSLIEKIQSSVKQVMNTEEYPDILSILSDIDQIVIIYVQGSRERPTLKGVLYDNIGRNKINMNTITLSKPIDKSAKEIDSFITSVYLEIGGKRIITSSTMTFGTDEITQIPKEKSTEEHSPIYTKWWFWITIVGSIALLITVPVVLINTGEPSNKDPNDYLDPFLRR